MSGRNVTHTHQVHLSVSKYLSTLNKQKLRRALWSLEIRTCLRTPPLVTGKAPELNMDDQEADQSREKRHEISLNVIKTKNFDSSHIMVKVWACTLWVTWYHNRKLHSDKGYERRVWLYTMMTCISVSQLAMIIFSDSAESGDATILPGLRWATAPSSFLPRAHSFVFTRSSVRNNEKQNEMKAIKPWRIHCKNYLAA